MFYALPRGCYGNYSTDVLIEASGFLLRSSAPPAVARGDHSNHSYLFGFLPLVNIFMHRWKLLIGSSLFLLFFLTVSLLRLELFS